jgi:hypothetical protein
MSLQQGAEKMDASEKIRSEILIAMYEEFLSGLPWT